MSVMIPGGVMNITPTGNCTFNTTKIGQIGDTVLIVITTTGVTSRTITFGTNFKSAGTLATGTVSGKVFCVEFRCIDGASWAELRRTTAL